MTRLRRKWTEIARYMALGLRCVDKCVLLMLALIRYRVLPRQAAVPILRAAGISDVTFELAEPRGTRIAVDPLDQAQIDVFDELLLERVYDLNRVTIQPDLVLDCGAFCGYFSVLAARAFPDARVVCYEPEPRNVERIRRQIAVARAEVELRPQAVSAQAGLAKFAGSGAGGSLVAGDDHPSAITVQCADLRHALREGACKRLLLKIDIEGEEVNVLQAILPALPQETFCFLETHRDDAVCDALLRPYRAAGFVVAQTRRRRAASAAFHYVEWTLCRTMAEGRP